jgi:hypothetical protein
MHVTVYFARRAAFFLLLAAWGTALFAQGVVPGRVDGAGGDRPAERVPLDAAARQERLARIEDLIRQLGDDRFAVREAAERELAELGKFARIPLERALEHPDAQTRTRAGRLLARLPEPSHTLVDALGAPIAGAAVVIRLVTQTSPQDPMPISVDQEQMDESDDMGRIGVPSVPNSSQRAIVDVFHPDYGSARYEVSAGREEKELRLPLVRAGSEARARALEGVVQGQDGKPIAGAVIRCYSVRTPGQGLINRLEPSGIATTDSLGRYSLYLPNQDRRNERGELIPPNSNFSIEVTMPEDESYFPVAGIYSNREPHVITLNRAERFHRFRFIGPDGAVIEDPRLLARIQVVYEYVRPTGGRTRTALGPSAATKGRPLLPGKYFASGHLNGASVQFEPLDVTAESPEELLFRLPSKTVYQGRVVHGVTGEPLAGAFVAATNGSAKNNLAMLTADEWLRLRGVASNPSLDHHALQALSAHFQVRAFVRSDEDGQFTVDRPPGDEFYALLAFAEDFVPFNVRIQSLATNGEEPVAAGEFPLFPAAKVLVRPVHGEGRLSVSPLWQIADDGQPEWIERFRAAPLRQDREFHYVHWLQLNEQQPLFVPAGVRLSLRFEAPYDDKWSPASVDAPIQLEPGAVHEIGEIRFAPALPAAVRVVDEAGKPVEGAPVRRKHADDRAWSVAHNTDAEGLAHFHVNPASRGQFRVSNLPGPREQANAENLFVDFAVAAAPPEQPFEIKLTAEQKRALLESPAVSRLPAQPQSPGGG